MEPADHEIPDKAVEESGVRAEQGLKTIKQGLAGFRSLKRSDQRTYRVILVVQAQGINLATKTSISVDQRPVQQHPQQSRLIASFYRT